MKPCKESKDALGWWGMLSINEQNKHISNHPFFSKMGSIYFGLHQTSITQVYEHYLKNIN